MADSSIPHDKRAAKAEYDRLYREKNREKIRERRARHYQENRDAVLLKNKTWRDNNIDEYRERQRNYERAHRTQARERSLKWKALNRDRVHEKTLLYYANNMDTIKARSAEWYANNPDRAKKRAHQWYVNNSDGVKTRTRLWDKAHPEVRRVNKHRRRARERLASGTHNGADIRLLFKASKRRCWWCGSRITADNYHVDHRIPLSRGGSNAPENLCISCPECNLSKGAKLPQEWNGRLL